jgi:hypothetical protein
MRAKVKGAPPTTSSGLVSPYGGYLIYLVLTNLSERSVRQLDRNLLSLKFRRSCLRQ